MANSDFTCNLHALTMRYRDAEIAAASHAVSHDIGSEFYRMQPNEVNSDGNRIAQLSIKIRRRGIKPLQRILMHNGGKWYILLITFMYEKLIIVPTRTMQI
jgi:hypothetical protein